MLLRQPILRRILRSKRKNILLRQIPTGATIEYCNRADEKSGLTYTVVDDHNVEYDGKKWSLSALAVMLTQSKWGVAVPRYFKYNGEWLNDIRKRLGV